ncbi:hypothetical protein [Archangium sp.]|uniref:hypothetical protein n=1 Tax=Archangium sp. TaxID=1872627 RepID=UPI002D55D6EB|nr:hypothetical protein [Archangium sp.]HYO55576.1 hypothetical protein [Archangium sp.]
MNPSIFAVTTAMLCLAASGVHAEEPAAPRPPHSVALETYAFSGTLNNQATTVVAPSIFASFALSQRVTLTVAWLFAYAPSRGGTPATFQAGNPAIGANAVLRDGAFKIRAGGALVLPFTLLSDPDDDGSALLRRAATLRGNSGVSLVAPGLLGLTPWADASLRQGLFRFALDARVPLSVQLSSKRGRRADAVFQLTGNVGLDVLPNLLVGTSLQAVYVMTAAADVDPSFLALLPYIRLHGSPGFVEARLTLNLDAPLGFAFDPNGVWAAGLALGTTF